MTPTPGDAQVIVLLFASKVREVLSSPHIASIQGKICIQKVWQSF